MYIIGRCQREAIKGQGKGKSPTETRTSWRNSANGMEVGPLYLTQVRRRRITSSSHIRLIRWIQPVSRNKGTGKRRKRRYTVAPSSPIAYQGNPSDNHSVKGIVKPPNQGVRKCPPERRGRPYGPEVGT